MGRSTLWLAQEENKRSLDNLVESLADFFGKNGEVSDEYEEGYRYGIGEFTTEEKYTIGTLVKYRKEHKTTTYIRTTREIAEEDTKGYPLIADAYFAISGYMIAVEERVPNIGHVMIGKILSKIAEQQSKIKGYEFTFINSKLAIEDIFKQALSEKITKIKFKNISENPDPENLDLKMFETLAKDTKSKDIELNNPKEGINPKSQYVNGGKILAGENKAEVHIETVTPRGQSKVYDTSEARNKVREKIEFEDKPERVQKIKENLIRFFINK